jgi:DNA polymerase-3 subunit epsilon
MPQHSLDRLFDRRDPMIVFDLETGGLDWDIDPIVSSCVALVPKDMGDGRGRPPRIFSRYINPGVPISAESTAIHGLTEEYLAQHGVEPAVAVEEAAGLLRLAVERGLPIVAFNARFDLTFLDRACRRMGIRPVAERPEDLRPVIDPFVLDKAADPYRKGKRRLENQCEHWGVKLEGAHDSTADALATGRVLFKMARGPIPRAASDRPYKTPQVDLTTMKVGELHDVQVEWAAQQAKSMAAYFRREASMAASQQEADELRRKADGCRPEWPFIPRDIPADQGGQGSLWE